MLGMSNAHVRCIRFYRLERRKRSATTATNCRRGWVGELISRLEYQKETYHRTRNAGVNYVTSVLVDHVKEKHRVLVGFDFPYGYPAGFSRAIGLPFGQQ